MMKCVNVINYWEPGTLSDSVVTDAVSFIRRRFIEDWSIVREEVTEKALNQRANISLYEGDLLIGWLGIEEDGELDNGCVEKNKSGVILLKKMIKEAFQQNIHDSLYAFVPVTRAASARACLSAGMRMDDPPIIVIKHYPERSMLLVRLYIEKPAERQGIVDREYVQNTITMIKSMCNC